MKGFFVSLGDLFEKHGAAQTGILTNKSHYKETRSFEYLNFPAKLQAELFDVTHTLLASRWRRSVVEFWACFVVIKYKVRNHSVMFEAF